MLDLINQTIIDKGLQIQEDTGFAFNYEVFKSEASGIVTYYMDNYETVTGILLLMIFLIQTTIENATSYI